MFVPLLEKISVALEETCRVARAFERHPHTELGVGQNALDCAVQTVRGRWVEVDDALAARLNSLYLKHRFEDIELYPDAIPALDLLAPRYRLGLLSNGNSYPERCGLQGYFSFVVFSQDVGHQKPDRRIFQVACDRAGCRPRELLHVGDSLESDVQGANSFGACAVWLNRYATADESAIRPTLEISSLEQLPRLLCGEPR